MTDLTTRPATAGTPQPAAATPVNGVAVADVRTLRHVTRAEQERLSADAAVERRARAAQLDLELRQQHRAAARREREADAADKQARAEVRRARRATRRARLRAAAPRWAERALLVLPILFPMAVAWVGQIRFAMTVMGWPLAAAIVFAAGFELSTAYVARLDWLSRAAGDSALLFRAATWGFAAGAATMNYWHAAGPGLAPTGEAVSYGLMSITGVVLWELLSTYRHRTALRAEGKRPAARPRFGLARWVWFRPLTRVAWLLTLRDGYPTTDLAWRAALAAVDLYGSPNNARNAVRAGRPVPHPELLDDGRDETAEHRDARPHEEQWAIETPRDIETRHDRDSTTRDIDRDHPGQDGQRDSRTGRQHRDNTTRDMERDAPHDDAAQAAHPDNSGRGTSPAEPDVQAWPGTTSVPEPSTDPAGGDPADRAGPSLAPDANRAHNRDRYPAPAAQPAADERDPGQNVGHEPGADRGPDPTRHDARDQAIGAKMLAYAQARLAEGAPVTGADLDRQFGTRDYGRKVLRRLATGSHTVGV